MPTDVLPDSVTGGATPPATEPAETELVDCVGLSPRSWLRRYSAWGAPVAEGVLGGLVLLYVGSCVAYNTAWAASACPIGGGSWTGWEDRESWFQFTAPADAPGYLGLHVVIDATGASILGSPSGYHIGIASGAIAAGRFGDHTPLASGTIGGITTVYIPRSHVAWGAVNSLILAPNWECARSFFTCNTVSYFGSPLNDGRGGSGGYTGIEPQTVCAVQFTSGATGLSGEVAAYGAVDGVNRTFTLIGWDGTGTPEHTVNGLEQTSSGVAFNRTTATATLAEPPPAGAIVLWDYTVGSIAGDITLTPDPVAIIIQVPEPLLPPDIFLLPSPVAVGVVVTEPFVDLA